MKTSSIISALLFVSLAAVSYAGGRVKLSTMVLTVPDSIDIPERAGPISEDEWRSILRSCARTKGVPLYSLPAVTTGSDKKARLKMERRDDDSGKFWSGRMASPVSPVTEINYTATPTRSGTDVAGEFVLNRDLVRDEREGEELVGGRIRVHIPDGKVLTFRLGGHLFGVVVSKLD